MPKKTEKVGKLPNVKYKITDSTILTIKDSFVAKQILLLHTLILLGSILFDLVVNFMFRTNLNLKPVFR